MLFFEKSRKFFIIATNTYLNKTKIPLVGQNLDIYSDWIKSLHANELLNIQSYIT